MLRLYLLQDETQDLVVAAVDKKSALDKARRRTGRGWPRASEIGTARKDAYNGQIIAGARPLTCLAMDAALDLLGAACRALDVDPADALLTKSPSCMLARWAVWLVLRKDFEQSYPIIARAFQTAAEPYDHTSVMYGLQQVEKRSLLTTDSRFAAAYHAARTAAQKVSPEARKALGAPRRDQATRRRQPDQPKAPRRAPRAELPAAVA